MKDQTEDGERLEFRNPGGEVRHAVKDTEIRKAAGGDKVTINMLRAEVKSFTEIILGK